MNQLNTYILLVLTILTHNFCSWLFGLRFRSFSSLCNRDRKIWGRNILSSSKALKDASILCIECFLISRIALITLWMILLIRLMVLVFLSGSLLVLSCSSNPDIERLVWCNRIRLMGLCVKVWELPCQSP